MPTSYLKVAVVSLAAYALCVLVQKQISIPVIGDYLPK